jgi:cell division protein FtsZ
MELLNTVRPSIIKVIGVGGGGSNAVSHMYSQGIKGVDFVICNTDVQALEKSQVLHKIQLGSQLTDGLGAGNKPDKGKNAALESIDEIKNMLSENTKMVFITAGMGGGTGTGAAPVIASIAKELGILTVGIVTDPFTFEGRIRKIQAEAGISEMKKYVDSLIVICNDKLRMLYGNLGVKEAFSKADDVLTTAAKGIAEIITVSGDINVDFEDVKTVLQDSGKAIMGFGTASGENRAIKAAEAALNSDLLNEENIKGANNILLNISSGNEQISMDELMEITDYVQTEAGKNANMIWGYNVDDTLGGNVNIVLVAAGFDLKPPSKELVTLVAHKKGEKEIIELDENMNEKNSKTNNVKESFHVSTDVEDIQTNQNSNKIVIDLFASENIVEQNAEMQVNKMSDENQITVKNTVHINDNEHQDNEDLDVQSQKTRIGRMKMLRDLSTKIYKETGLSEIENVPAYERRGVQLKNIIPSDESNLSDSRLSKGDDNSIQINPNNSFLHDNVD